jgi:hypothetical protein
METSDARKRRMEASACASACGGCKEDGLQGPDFSDADRIEYMEFGSPLGFPCVPLTDWTTTATPLDEVIEDIFDPVKEPYHYTRSEIEVWDAIRAWGLGYFTGAAVKYIARHEHKGNAVQDLEKAVAYLTKEIEFLRAQQTGM